MPAKEELDIEMAALFQRSKVSVAHITGLQKPFEIQVEERTLLGGPRRKEDDDAPEIKVVDEPVLAPPKPTIEEIYGNNGSVFGNSTRGIRGTNFIDGAKVFFGNGEATNVHVVDDTYLTCTVPTLSPISSGATPVDLKVFNVPNNDDFKGTLAHGYTYYVAPAPTSINPTSGPAAGGTPFDIFVAANSLLFGSGYIVRFGGVPVPVTVSPGFGVFGSTPAFPGATGQVVSVEVVAPDYERQKGTLVNAFTFGTPPPPPSPDPPLGFLWAGPGYGIGFGFYQSTWAQVRLTAVNSSGGFYSTYNGTISLFVSFQPPEVGGIEISVDPSNVPMSNGVADFLVRVVNLFPFPPSSVQSFRMMARDNAHPAVQTESPNFASANFYPGQGQL